MTETAKSVLGKTYHLDKVIGRGSYGTTWKGYNSEDSVVAVKIPHTEGVSSALRVTRNSREAYFLKKTDHINFAYYLDHSENPNQPYLVMQHIPKSFQNLISTNQLTQEIIATYILQIPEVLNLLGEEGIYHLDLRCPNIGLKKEGEEDLIKVMDFGCALPNTVYVFPPEVHETLPINFPPEVRKRGLIDTSCDIYMAGKALEIMLTGEIEENFDDTLRNIRLRHRLKSLPETFIQFLKGMIHHQPQNRVKDTIRLEDLAEEAVEDLEQQELFTFQNFALVSASQLHFMGTSSSLASWSYPT